MNPEQPASLNDLRDIVEAEAVSWWPLAAGWWLLIVVAAVVSGIVALRLWRKYRGNAYRRAAMRQLRSANTDVQIAQLLKRTALATFPRAEIAPLTGSTWIHWLEETGGAPCPALAAQRLTEGVFASANAGASPELRDFVAAWINNHQGPAPC